MPTDHIGPDAQAAINAVLADDGDPDTAARLATAVQAGIDISDELERMETELERVTAEREQARAELTTEHQERIESEAWGRQLRTELTKVQNERNAALRTIAAIREARTHTCGRHCTEGGCDFDLGGFIDRVDEILATAPPAALGSPPARAQEPDSIALADQWITASGIPVHPYEHVRAWLDRLRVPVPAGIHPLMAEIRRAVIAAGDAGYAAGRARVALRPASWEQEAADAVRDAVAPLSDDGLTQGRIARTAVRAIIDAGLAGPGGRCPRCQATYPRTPGDDPRCWTCTTDTDQPDPEPATQQTPAHDHTGGLPLFDPDATLHVTSIDGDETWTGAEWNDHARAATRHGRAVPERMVQCPRSVCTTTCPVDQTPEG